MKKELDEALCEKYPLIFANRNADMRTTAMCWGFECGDGWYDLIDALCSQIQNHIDSRQARIEWVEKDNEIIRHAKQGDFTLAEEKYASFLDNPKHHDWALNLIAAHATKEFTPVPDTIHQVVAAQVKEKFGTLRFYYDGGNESTDALVDFAETMSGIICDVCGNRGTTRGGGWLTTRCDTHVKTDG